MRPTSPLLTYGGLALAVAGFGLIALAWVQTATRDTVSFQIPWLVSAGLSGLGLIVLGATAINIAAKRHEGALRARQLEQLTAIVRAVAREIAPDADEVVPPARSGPDSDDTGPLTPAASAPWEASG